MNTTNSSSVLFCSMLQGSIVFGVESCILFVFAIVSATLNYLFLQILFNSGGHLPLNVKLLLINGSVASLIKSIIFGLRSVYNICLLVVGFESMVLDRIICIIIDAPYALCAFTLPTSMVFIGFDRLWSTWKKNLPRCETIKAYMMIMLFLAWTVSIVIYIGSMVIDQHLTSKNMCYCYFPMATSPNGSMVFNVILTISQSFNIIIYIIVYVLNKRSLLSFTANTARYNLTERFIMWGNIKATVMLIPPSLLHAASIYFVLTTLAILRDFFHFKLSDNYLIALTGMACAMCLDTLLHPILCLIYSKSLNEVGEKIYPNVFCWIIRWKSPEARHGKRAVSVIGQSTKLATISSKKQQSLRADPSVKGRAVVEYHLKPEQHQDILEQMWNNHRLNKRGTKPKSSA